MNVIDVFNQINWTCKKEKCEAFLHGPSLFDIVNGVEPEIIEVFIKTRKSFFDAENIFNKFNNKIIKIRITSKIPSSPFTAYNIVVGMDDFLDNNFDKISPVNSFKDAKKRVIKFTKEAKLHISDNPHYLMDILVEYHNKNLIIDANNFMFLFNNKSLLKLLEKRKIFNYFRNLLGFPRPRKIISLMNTLGYSDELFGIKLVESPFVNHLHKSDYYEMLSIIFDNVEIDELEDFLVTELGFHLRDTKFVVNLRKSISEIEDESEKQARLFLRTLGSTQRLKNVCRLLKTMGFSELSKKIKFQKDYVITKDKLCVNENILKSVFGSISEQTINNLIKIASDKVIEDPEFNKQTFLLNYLNKKKGTLWHEEKELSS